jgi:hypothetical protein
MTRLSARDGGRAVYIGSASLSLDVVVRQRGTADSRIGAPARLRPSNSPDHRGRWMKTTRAPRQTHSLAWHPSLVAQMPDGLLVAGSEDCEARIETKMSEREAVDHAVTTGRFHQSTKSWPAIASSSATRQAFVLWVVNIPDVHQPSTRLSSPVTSSPLQSAESRRRSA